MRAFCPDCRSKIELLEDPVIGMPVTCQKCGARLEVIWLYPLSLDFPENELYPFPPAIQPENN